MYRELTQSLINSRFQHLDVSCHNHTNQQYTYSVHDNLATTKQYAYSSKHQRIPPIVHVKTSHSTCSHISIHNVLKHAWAPSTSAKYATDLHLFHSFCEQHNISPSEHLLASQDLLCSYIASLSGTQSGSTIRGKVAAIRAWHIYNDTPWFSSIRLVYVLKGATNLTPTTSLCSPCLPVMNDMLLLLSSSLNLQNHFDTAIFFTACAAFWGQLRLGEILPPTQFNYDITLLLHITNISSPSSMGSRSLHLPHTKTSPVKGELVMLCRQ
jgi:hypothetical protein